MKLLIVAAVLATAYADFRFLSAREQEGPYQPSGWRPSGAPFALPLRQQLPRLEYGPPPQNFGPPAQEYGPPTEATPTTTTESQEITTTELPTTTENVQEVEQLANSRNEVRENEKLKEGEAAVTQQGIYYIYHPTGLLQRVVYMTRNDLGKMAYSAQLKYEDVQPIREPIYTYDPRTLAFRQLQI